MLEADPEDRPSASEAIKHKWFSEDKQVLKTLLKNNTSNNEIPTKHEFSRSIKYGKGAFEHLPNISIGNNNNNNIMA
jgi:hypothetical protein